MRKENRKERTSGRATDSSSRAPVRRRRASGRASCATAAAHSTVMLECGNAGMRECGWGMWVILHMLLQKTSGIQVLKEGCGRSELGHYLRYKRVL